MKTKYLGTSMDRAILSGTRRPAFRISIWNPNLCSVADVVLGQARSPEYDLTPWVQSYSLSKNASFENNEDASAPSLSLVLTYEPEAQPIPISERTLVDGAPIWIWVGDEAADPADWVIDFTGVVRGKPTMVRDQREPGSQRQMRILAVGREEAFFGEASKIVAHSYEEGEDLGKVAVETAIEFMQLDRREIRIEAQGYVVGQSVIQIVDVESLKGIYEVLFPTGKKPVFDAEGFLIAADTDLDKAPARVYHPNKDLIISIARTQGGASFNNSVRLLGLSNVLTEVDESDKRLAHGEITSGFFETKVNVNVSFSEASDKETGARRAKNTYLKSHVGRIGIAIGEGLAWEPVIEPDGFTCFGGRLSFDTGFAPELRGAMIGVWTYGMAVELIGETMLADAVTAVAAPTVISIGKALQTAGMLAVLFALSELGRVEWQIFGVPFQNVFQQLCATATLHGTLTKDLKEREYRSDFIYTIEDLRARALQLLKRELVKSEAYEIVMISDEIIDIDDVIQIGDEKYYVISIARTVSRSSGFDGKMSLVAWRIA